jgi:hypothetical protein
MAKATRGGRRRDRNAPWITGSDPRSQHAALTVQSLAGICDDP